jgi:hypothetical protein
MLKYWFSKAPGYRKSKSLLISERIGEKINADSLLLWCLKESGHLKELDVDWRKS